MPVALIDIKFAHYKTKERLFVLQEVNPSISGQDLKHRVKKWLSTRKEIPTSTFENWHVEVPAGPIRRIVEIDEEDESCSISDIGISQGSIVFLDLQLISDWFEDELNLLQQRLAEATSNYLRRVTVEAMQVQQPFSG